MSELVAYHLAGAWGLPSVSPFCLKLDAYLRMAALPHVAKVAATPFAAPKRKAPWIEHEGKAIGDSGFIIDYLNTRFSIDLNAGLTGEQRAAAHALRRLIEENLYWSMVFDRWVVEPNWALFRNVVLGGVPAPARLLIAPIARRGVRQQLRGHGIGVHSRDEIHAIGVRDIQALSDYLAAKPYFMGDVATEIDAVAFGQLANIMRAPIASPVKDAALKQPNLAAFLDRFQARYYS